MTRDEQRDQFYYAVHVRATCPEVYAAFSDPAALAAWWGPTGSETTILEAKIEDGGTLRYRLTAPDGARVFGRLDYLHLDPNSRVEFLSAFTNAAGSPLHLPEHPHWPLHIHNEVALLTDDATATVVTFGAVPFEASVSERATFRAGRPALAEAYRETGLRLQAFLADAPASDADA